MRLEVRLLGGVEVVLDGRRLREFNSPRLQRFLALLVLRRGPQHRSQLAFELWPNSNERQARTNLRKLLHEFRHALPGFDNFVEFDNETLCWKTDGPSAVDVVRFGNAVAAGDLELAAHIYAGDLLPGCYDDWVGEERDRPRTEAMRAMAQLAEAAAIREDRESTIRHTQRIVEFEPTHESAVRLQMEAHFALGPECPKRRPDPEARKNLLRIAGGPDYE